MQLQWKLFSGLCYKGEPGKLGGGWDSKLEALSWGRKFADVEALSSYEDLKPRELSDRKLVKGCGMLEALSSKKEKKMSSN